MMMTNNQDDGMRMGRSPTIAARRPFSYNIETKSTAAVAEPCFADLTFSFNRADAGQGLGFSLGFE